MVSFARLNAIITANPTGFIRGITQAKVAARGLTGTMGGLGNSIKSIGSGLVVGAAIKGFFDLINVANEFERALNQSLAIMDETARAMRDDFSKAALEMARTSKFSAKEVADSFFFLASAGLNAQQSLAALPQIVAFAQAGMFDLAEATSLATDAQSSLGLKSKNAAINLQNLTRVTNVLVRANTLADATTEQFARALTSKAGPAARLLGVEVEDAVAALAVFADQGLKGEKAGNTLSIVFRDLQTKSIRNEKAFNAAGIAVFDTAEKFRGLKNIVKDLEEKLDGMSVKMKKATLLTLGFQDKSVSAIQTLLGFSGELEHFGEELRKEGDIVQDVASRQLTDLDKAIQRLNSTWTEFSQTIDGTNIAEKILNTFEIDIAGLGKDIEFMEELVAGVDAGFKRTNLSKSIDITSSGDILRSAERGELLSNEELRAARIRALGTLGSIANEAKALFERGSVVNAFDQFFDAESGKITSAGIKVANEIRKSLGVQQTTEGGGFFGQVFQLDKVKNVFAAMRENIKLTDKMKAKIAELALTQKEAAEAEKKRQETFKKRTAEIISLNKEFLTEEQKIEQKIRDINDAVQERPGLFTNFDQASQQLQDRLAALRDDMAKTKMESSALFQFDKLAESLDTPIDKAKDEIAELNKAFLALQKEDPLAAQAKTGTFFRLFEAIKARLKDQVGLTEKDKDFRTQTLTPAAVGDRIQNAVLNRENTDKKMLELQKLATGYLETLATNRTKGIFQFFGGT